MSNLTELGNALVELEEEKVKKLVDERIEAGEKPIKVIKECNAGMVKIGELFEEDKYFLSELIVSGEILSDVMDKLEPLMDEEETSEEEDDSLGTVVIGTVKEDIHDIGKNIVITLLKGTGFDIVDLGVDVEPDEFVDAIKETGAKALGMSALLNFTYPNMKEVVEALEEADLRDDVKVMIGGAPCNEEVREFVGADYYAEDAATGVKICKEIYK